MSDTETEQAEQEVAGEEPLDDALGEEDSEATLFGWIAQKTEGNFTAARRIIDRYMQRLQALEAEAGALTESVDEQIATHEAEVEALADLRQTLVGKLEQERTRITWMLEGAWHDFREPIKAILGSKGKTWKLTNGSISSKKQQAVLTFDEKAAIAWIEEMPDIEKQGRLLDHVTSLKRGEMKKQLTIHPSGAVLWTDTGEVLDFAVAEIREDAITITPRPPAAQEEN